MSKPVIVAEFPSRVDPNRIHRLKQFEDSGELFCSCPRYYWDDYCSHIRDYLQVLEEDKEAALLYGNSE